MQGSATYGSVRNLVETSNLPVSKVIQFLLSKPSYTNFTPATRKIRKTKAFTRFENEILCMDSAYVGKLAKDENSVMYLLVRQDLFERSLEPKGMKTKDSKEMVRAILTMIKKTIQPTKIRIDKGTEFAREFKKVCKAEGLENYYTMSSTKAGFAECTVRSIKNTIYRYMEDYGYKHIHKLLHLSQLRHLERIVRLT